MIRYGVKSTCGELQKDYPQRVENELAAQLMVAQVKTNMATNQGKQYQYPRVVKVRMKP